MLVFIYDILPGHNFGLAVIIFTVIARLILWPLVKKQLHQTKLMRKLQPEIKAIKAKTKGNKQEESRLTMELYKERGVNPLGSIVVLIPQFIILIGLYSGLRRVVEDPNQLITFSYSWLHFGWMDHLASNIHLFDGTLFGVIDLTRTALTNSGIYWPAMVLVIGSAVVQYFSSKQLLPSSKDTKSLRQVLKEAGQGQQADQSDISASVGRSTRFLLPVFILLITIHLPAALGLYWLVSGLVAYIQQAIILREDTEEMENEVKVPEPKKSTKNTNKITETEVVSTEKTSKPKRQKSSAKKRKRRR